MLSPVPGSPTSRGVPRPREADPLAGAAGAVIAGSDGEQGVGPALDASVVAVADDERRLIDAAAGGAVAAGTTRAPAAPRASQHLWLGGAVLFLAGLVAGAMVTRWSGGGGGDSGGTCIGPLCAVPLASPSPSPSPSLLAVASASPGVGPAATPSSPPPGQHLASVAPIPVYIYDVPQGLLYGDVPLWYRCLDLMVQWRQCYALEWLVPEALQAEARRLASLNVSHEPGALVRVVSDPREARLYLLPHTATLRFHLCIGPGTEPEQDCGRRIRHHVLAVLDWVRRAHPYWNASGGADHALIFSQDGSFGFARGDGELPAAFEGATIIANLGSLQSTAFDEARDVVSMPFGIPPLPPDHPPPVCDATFDETLVPQLIDGGAERDPTAWLPVLQRPRLVFFAGGMHGRRRKEMAAALASAAANDSRVSWVPPGVTLSPTGYAEALRTAQFCLHLPGYSGVAWSGRIAHIVAQGCIPVIVLDNLRLPLDTVVDWRTFSLRVFEADAVQPGYLYDLLLRVSDAAKVQMQRNLARVASAMRYRYPAQPGDASHWLLASTWARMASRLALRSSGLQISRLALNGGDGASAVQALLDWRYDGANETHDRWPW